MDSFVNKALSTANIAKDIDEQELAIIGSEMVDRFKENWALREPWLERTEEALKLATQVIEEKSFPWPNAANVKFPLLTTAAMQFAARAYPALVPNDKLVKGVVVGKDPDGQKREKADRIAAHMSYQILYEMDNWEEDMDKLCLILPIIGCAFKKSYYDTLEKKNVSRLVLPKNLVIDYYATSIESAHYKAEILELDDNKIYERTNAGIFLDVDLGDAQNNNPARTDTSDEIAGTDKPSSLESTPHTFIECHTFWDLDDDGYEEPYVITVHLESAQVVRISARFDAENITQDAKKIHRIKPTEYYTKFGFIPNPDGSIYDLGFGLLLGGINSTVNTLTNQLLDSGTLSNLQSGFLGRGIRIRAGQTKFTPGEWKVADFTGDDIKRHIFPLPVREPSNVLLQLLQALVTSGKEVASVAEIFTGKMPGQNTPATTTMATVEQSMKVFTAIYKRIFRALGQEYQKLYRLNKINLDKEVYYAINPQQGMEQGMVSPSDYDNDITVRPSADPNIASETQKLAKAQGLLELVQLGTVNPQVVTKRVLEAQEQVNIQELLEMPPPPPDPEAQKAQMEAQMKQQEFQQSMQQKEADFAYKQKEAQLKLMYQEQMQQLKMQQQEMQGKMDAAMKQQEIQLEQIKQQMKLMAEHHKQQTERHKNDESIRHEMRKNDIKEDKMEKEGEDD